tara:strand:- start:3273 stop:4610 length:1338 start_codon:yes stop_codon:yes gene_type:complete
MLPKIVIFGRPNVGKSTLFNRLIKRKAAIVADVPGVTRDNKSLRANMGDLEFLLYDTAGFDGFEEKNLLSKNILDKINQIINIADVIIFMLDAKTGIVPFDYTCAKVLRKINCPVVLLLNKCDSENDRFYTYDFLKLGFGEPIVFSAEHSIGFENLKENILKNIKNISFDSKNINNISAIRLAIVGKPNSGKSTLINTLIGKNIVLTGNEPGITRDSIMLDFLWKNQDFVLIDTAGLRKKNKILDKVEQLSVKATMDSVKYAQIVVLVLDINESLSKQDLNIASHVIGEGRVLVIAANKWDLVESKDKVKLEILEKLNITLSQLRGVKLIEISALNKTGINNLMESVMIMYKKWNINISTSKLNKWLLMVQEKNPPPLKSGRVMKIKYCTQTSSRPPTFSLFTNYANAIQNSYKRYLLNNFREEFDLEGVPIRIMYKNSKNPYSK